LSLNYGTSYISTLTVRKLGEFVAFLGKGNVSLEKRSSWPNLAYSIENLKLGSNFSIYFEKEGNAKTNLGGMSPSPPWLCH